MLDHERLDVYRTAIEFLQLAFRLREVLPRGHAALADQFRRAAMSVPLNIAEGAGKTPNERVHHHRIARGSAMECGAVVDVVRLLKVASPEDLDRAKELLVRIVSMLTRMCR
jgi:four helix bundle protein